MTDAEFKSQMTRLSLVYGDKAYPSERLNMIHKSVRFVNAEIMEMAIDRLIANNQYAPMLEKISEAIQAAKKERPNLAVDRYGDLRKQLSDFYYQSTACDKCSGRGVFTAYEKANMGLSSIDFFCSCRAAGIARQLPENRGTLDWNLRNADQFVRHFDWLKNPSLLESSSETDEQNHVKTSLAKASDVLNEKRIPTQGVDAKTATEADSERIKNLLDLTTQRASIPTN